MTLDMSEPAEQTSALSDPQCFASRGQVRLYFTSLAGKMLSSKIEQRVNLKCLVKLNKTLTECLQMLRKKLPELWQNDFILHQDNAPSHTVLSVKQFLVEK